VVHDTHLIGFGVSHAKLDIVRRISKLPGRIRRHGDERGAKIGHALDLCKVTPHN